MNRVGSNNHVQLSCSGEGQVYGPSLRWRFLINESKLRPGIQFLNWVIGNFNLITNYKNAVMLYLSRWPIENNFAISYTLSFQTPLWDYVRHVVVTSYKNVIEIKLRVNMSIILWNVAKNRIKVKKFRRFKFQYHIILRYKSINLIRGNYINNILALAFTLKLGYR